MKGAPVCARKQSNGPPVIDQGFSTGQLQPPACTVRQSGQPPACTVRQSGVPTHLPERSLMSGCVQGHELTENVSIKP